MKPNVEKGQIWRHASSLDGQGGWRYAYFLILDVRDGTISDWEYDFLPLTPNIDRTKSMGYSVPLNHKSEWLYVC